MKAQIISLEKIGQYYHVIRLSVPEGYKWQPGQFAKFTLDPIDLGEEKNFRIFSIASIMEENQIIIATKALPDKTSKFKQKLFSLKAGDEIEISNAMGNFTLRDDVSPMILYASGIGVTPIRSLVLSLRGKAKQAIRVVYASYDNYIFEDELEAAKEDLDLQFIRTVEVEETMNTLKAFANDYGNAALYYISGAPFVVNAVKTAYAELGINSNRMIDDSFVGY